MMQLVGDGVDMLDPMRNTEIGPEEVEARFGVGPERVIDVQALAGDSTDNVPGAPGIGVKTAALLINEYGDLDTLLASAEEIKQPKRRQTLLEKADQIRLSRDLVTLRQDVPVEHGLGEFELKEPDPDTLLGFLVSMECRTLTDRVAEALGVEPPVRSAPAAEASAAAGGEGWQPGAVREWPAIDDAHEVIGDAEALQAVIAEAYETGLRGLSVSANAEDAMAADLCGAALSPQPGRGFYRPLGHRMGEGDLLGGDLLPGQMGVEAALDLLRPVLQDASILKIGHDVKF